jgi:pilus assembly protein CpaF
VSVSGTVISLRIPGRTPFTLEALRDAGTVNDVGFTLLRTLIDERLNFLVTGGTGSGKTTILAALLGAVGERERLVIVEDSAELDPAHPHVVRMQSRLANAEGAGALGLRDLVRQALRMRPDRIVVGEVRGPEVVDLLMAINTGHDGCCGTVHANSADDVPARLEALGLTAGLDARAVHALMGAGLDALVHVERNAQGARQVASISGLVRDTDGTVRTVPFAGLERGSLQLVYRGGGTSSLRSELRRAAEGTPLRREAA